MSNQQWTAVDAFIDGHLAPSDPALEAALRASDDAGLPAIQLSPSQGKLLHLLAVSCGARRCLEIGTLGGYSAIWLARALPAGGRLITLEADATHADVARANIARAGLDDAVEVRCAMALDALPAMEAAGDGPFDLIFIDADKAGNPEYFHWAVRLSRRGSVIIVDNVVREGAVIDSDSSDADVTGIRRLFEVMAAEPRVSATAIQTVGSKGWDGFALAVVIEEI